MSFSVEVTFQNRNFSIYGQGFLEAVGILFAHVYLQLEVISCG